MRRLLTLSTFVLLSMTLLLLGEPIEAQKTGQSSSSSSSSLSLSSSSSSIKLPSSDTSSTAFTTATPFEIPSRSINYDDSKWILQLIFKVEMEIFMVRFPVFRSKSIKFFNTHLNDSFVEKNKKVEKKYEQEADPSFEIEENHAIPLRRRDLEDDHADSLKSGISIDFFNVEQMSLKPFDSDLNGVGTGINIMVMQNKNLVLASKLVEILKAKDLEGTLSDAFGFEVVAFFSEDENESDSFTVLSVSNILVFSASLMIGATFASILVVFVGKRRHNSRESLESNQVQGSSISQFEGDEESSRESASSGENTQKRTNNSIDPLMDSEADSSITIGLNLYTLASHLASMNENDSIPMTELKSENNELDRQSDSVEKESYPEILRSEWLDQKSFSSYLCGSKVISFEQSKTLNQESHTQLGTIQHYRLDVLPTPSIASPVPLPVSPVSNSTISSLNDDGHGVKVPINFVKDGASKNASSFIYAENMEYLEHTKPINFNSYVSAVNDASPANQVHSSPIVSLSSSCSPSSPNKSSLHEHTLESWKHHLLALILQENETKIVKLLEETCMKDVDINEPLNDSGYAAIHLACSSCSSSFALWLTGILLRHGASPSTLTNDGQNALHLSSSLGYLEVVKLLCENDPHLISMRDSRGQIPMYNSILHSHFNCFNYLLPMTLAMKDEGDHRGRTALHWAAYFGNSEFVESLLQAYSPRNAQDNEGLTPLHLAAKEGHVQNIQIFLNFRVKTDILDYEGKTALDYALQNEHSSVVALLSVSRWKKRN